MEGAPPPAQFRAEALRVLTGVSGRRIRDIAQTRNSLVPPQVGFMTVRSPTVSDEAHTRRIGLMCREAFRGVGGGCEGGYGKVGLEPRGTNAVVGMDGGFGGLRGGRSKVFRNEERPLLQRPNRLVQTSRMCAPYRSAVTLAILMPAKIRAAPAVLLIRLTIQARRPPLASVSPSFA